MNLAFAIDLFLQHLVNEEKSDKTVKAYGMCMNHFKAWLDSSWDEISDLEDVTQTVVRDFKSYLESKVVAKTKRHLAPTTVNHYLIALRSFLLFARSKGVVFKSEPVAGIKLKVIANQNQTKWLSNEEIAKISHVIELLKYAGEKGKLSIKPSSQYW